MCGNRSIPCLKGATMEQSIPVAIQFDQFLILGVWVVLGVICSVIAAAIMQDKGQSASAGLFLGFFLNVLGVAFAIICPASPELQARALARYLDTDNGARSTPPRGGQPIATRRPPPDRRGRRGIAVDSPTARFLARKPQPEQPSAEDESARQEVAQRSQEIAELMRKTRTGE